MTGETEGALIVHEEVPMTRGMGIVARTALPVPHRFVNPAPPGFAGAGKDILVARDAEVIPGVGEQL